MKYYFCLVPRNQQLNGTNVGRTYAYQHKDKWIEAPSDFANFLTVGYVKGVDHVVVDNKAYSMMKSYIDIAGKFVVFVCTESISGCDV